MKWFAEHRLFTVVSGIVLILCIVIIVSFLSAGGSTAAGRGIQAGFSVIQRPFSYAASVIRKNVTGIFEYRHLQKENAALQKKVDRLEKKNTELTLKKDELRQLEKLSRSFDYTPFRSSGKAKIGRVIEIDNSNPYVVFRIDIGTADQIHNNDIVVDGSGLVGRIQEASRHSSKVVSILSNSNSISFKSQRRTSVMGVLKGDGRGSLSGYLMSTDASVLKGDVLVTSGIGIYPEGLRIGTVSSVDYDEDTQLKTVKVKPTVHFNSEQKVAVYYDY
ncbi:MAG: rod shape-determining protein MreC [Anaerovoracaceae bacterium]|jgi:rod shape-determining protein MreC